MLRLKGKKWGDLSKEDQKKLLRNANALEKEGDSIIDLDNDFSVAGRVEGEIIIDDEAVIYNPTGRCTKEDVYDNLKRLEDQYFEDLDELKKEIVECYDDYEFDGESMVMCYDREDGEYRHILNYVDSLHAPEFAVYFDPEMDEEDEICGYRVYSVSFLK